MARHGKQPTLLSKVLKVFVGLLALALIGTLGFAGFLYYQSNNSLDKIERQDLLPSTSTETTPPPTDGKPINYLLLGSDSRGAEDVGRSDTIMLAHIPSDRKNIYLISLPRDLYVDIPGHEKQKINAAYSFGGVPLTVSTVEEFIGAPVSHAAIIDFQGFIGLIDSLGGVEINNPHEGCDTSQGGCWVKGKQTLDSKQALRYVRWRHGLPNGDLTRGQNQQRVLKAIMSKTLSRDTLTNPSKLMGVLDDVSSYVTVDSTLTNDKIRNTALGMRVTSGSDVRTLTIPISGFESVPTFGDVDVVDEVTMDELREALANDTVGEYWEKYKKRPIAGAQTAPDTTTTTTTDPTTVPDPITTTVPDETTTPDSS